MPKQDFQERLQSLYSSLCFISQQHGQFKFGHQDRNEHRLKISSTIEYNAGVKNLFERLQVDLQRLDVWNTARWQAVSEDHSAYIANWRANLTSASTLEEQTYESHKQAGRLSLRLLEDHHSKLIVFEFTLEPLTTPAG